MNNNILTMADYSRLLAARYIAGGHDRETAVRFAEGEINAILLGNHRTGGEPTQADPQRLILIGLSPEDREYFTERAGILEYEGGLSRADAEERAISEILTPAPEVKEIPPTVYRGSAAIKRTLSAGIGVKGFFAKSKDNDPSAYTTDLGEITALWEQGKRRFKAFVHGHFLCLDIDRKPDKPDGLKFFYKTFPRETLPTELQALPESFPCYTQTPSGGFHLYFRYSGPEVKLRELAPAIEIKEWQITSPGSEKETGGYVLYGDFSEAPPLYGFLLDYIEQVKRKREQERAARSRPQAADRPMRFTVSRITLDALAGEAASSYDGHHDRQVSFAGRACRCKFSGTETLAYVKANPNIFGFGADTENTVLSVFKDNGGRL